MKVGLGDVTINSGIQPVNFLLLTEVDAGDGRTIYQNAEGQTFQQLPGGGYKFDTVPNPGDYEKGLRVGNVVAWEVTINDAGERAVYMRFVSNR